MAKLAFEVLVTVKVGLSTVPLPTLASYSIPPLGELTCDPLVGSVNPVPAEIVVWVDDPPAPQITRALLWAVVYDGQVYVVDVVLEFPAGKAPSTPVTWLSSNTTKCMALVTLNVNLKVVLPEAVVDSL